MDAFGNFDPNVGLAFTAPTPPKALDGTGVPSNATGKNLDLYENNTTGDVYEKQNMAWVIKAKP